MPHVHTNIMKKNILFLILSALLINNCSNQSSSEKESSEKNGKLIWSDEFDYAGLPDGTKWAYDVGDTCDRPSGCGWGNNEKQYYTEKELKNARVENGHLIIEARAEKKGQADYTSARLVTRGISDLQYGRVEVRAKLPTGTGTWPAIWMMPTQSTYGGWPKSGEIDIMEHVGFDADTIHGTVHTEAFNHLIGTQKSNQLKVEDAETAFHVYAINWTAEQMDFFVDDQLYFTFKNSGNGPKEWPFDHPFYLILNIAVGGNWGGAQGIDPDIWPQQMFVDYVRFYKL